MARQDSPRSCFVNQQSLTPYHPAKHISDTPVSVLLVYAPPYGESPEEMVRA